jgi:glucokinase
MPQACVIGLDIGGTKIAGGVVLFPQGAIAFKETIPTAPQRGGERVLDDAIELTRALYARAREQGHSIQGVGIGVCELVDSQGRVTSGQTLAWSHLDVAGRFGGIVPALVESDVRAAALAEGLFGAGRPFDLFAYVTVGTGISHTLVQEGRAFAGSCGNALILSSGALTFDCPHCGVRTDFVLEEFASGPGLLARYNQASQRQVSRAEEIFSAAAEGDREALQVLISGGEALGNVVAFLVNVLDPAAIVVGGGLGVAGGPYWDAFEASTRNHIWHAAARALPIIPAALGIDAGIIGAAAAFQQKFLAVENSNRK